MFEALVDGGGFTSQTFGCTTLKMEPPGCKDHCPGQRIHTGIDVVPLGGCGTPARALGSGTVVQIGGNCGGPFAVSIRSGRVVIRFWHLAGNAVQVGDRVHRGQVVGWIGTLGCSTGCHLHYEVDRLGDEAGDCTALDPAPYLWSWPGEVAAVGSGGVPAPAPSFNLGLAALALATAGLVGYGVHSEHRKGTW